MDSARLRMTALVLDEISHCPWGLTNSICASRRQTLRKMARAPRTTRVKRVDLAFIMPNGGRGTIQMKVFSAIQAGLNPDAVVTSESS